MDLQGHSSLPEPANARRPWLGAAAFPELRAAKAEQFTPTTREEAFWRRRFPGLFAPNAEPSLFARFLLHVTVTPMAFVTFLNVHYQLYLVHLLHTTPAAWLGHLVCVPLNVGLLFYALAFVPRGSVLEHAGPLLFLLLCVWYGAMARKLGNPLWGLVSCVTVALLFVTGTAAGRVAADSTTRPWTESPLFLFTVVSFLQASGHLFERGVPPRANRSDGWMTTRQFLWGGPDLSAGRRLARLAWTPIGAFWGALDEWWSSAKLLPLFLLQGLWALGYKPDQRREFQDEALRAMRSGDPAMDWVGTGGGAFARALVAAELERVS